MSDTHTHTVQRASFLTLHYRLSGPDGDIINTFTDAPATLQMGNGSLVGALEDYLVDLPEGSHKTFDLPAGSVFGDVDPHRQHWINRNELIQEGDSKTERHVGEVLQFSTSDGQTHLAATIIDLNEQAVLLDFNHPLAGRPLVFEVQIIAIL